MSARDAAELVAFGLRPRLRPDADARYAELWHRYRSDSAFRETVEEVAAGLGLDVLGRASETAGLVLAPEVSSVFAFRLVDYRAGLDTEERMLVGLVLLAGAALAYPTPDDLDEPGIRRVGVTEIDEFIRRSSAVSDDTTDAALALYLARPSYKAKMRGSGRSRDCTQQLVREVLDWCVEQGFARVADERRWGPECFQLLERFRVQVDELAGSSAFEAFASSAAGTRL